MEKQGAATPHDLPEGWEYGGVVMSSHKDLGGVQVVTATRHLQSSDGCRTTVTVQARSLEALVGRAHEVDRTHLRPEDCAHDMLVSRKELMLVLNQNHHLLRQVRELQQGLTLKEEQLRAHRRVKLPAEQTAALKRDLEETTNSVLAKYAPQSVPPPPKTKSGEFLVVCPSCTDRASTIPG